MKKIRAVQFLGIIFILSGVRAADAESDNRRLLNTTQTSSGFLSGFFNKLVALIKMQISTDIQQYLQYYPSKSAFRSISMDSNKLVKDNSRMKSRSETNSSLDRLKNSKSESSSDSDGNQYLRKSTRLSLFPSNLNNNLKQRGNAFFVKVQPIRGLSRKKRNIEVPLAAPLNSVNLVPDKAAFLQQRSRKGNMKKNHDDEKIEEDIEELINDLEDIKANRKTTPSDGGDKKSKKKKEKGKGKGSSKKEKDDLELDDDNKSTPKSKAGGKKGKDKEDSSTTTEKDDDDDDETTTKKPSKGKKSKGKEDASTTTEKDDDDDDETTTKKPSKGKKGKGKEDSSTTTEKDDDDDEPTTKKPPKGKKGKGKDDASTTTEKDDDDDDEETTTTKPPKGKKNKGKEGASTTTEKDDDDDETTTKKPPKGKKGKGKEDASTTTEKDDDDDETTTKGENTTTKKPKSGGKPEKGNNEIDINDIFGASHFEDASKKNKDKKDLDDLIVVGFAIKGNKLQKLPVHKYSGKSKGSKVEGKEPVEGKENPYEEFEEYCDEDGFPLPNSNGKNGNKQLCTPKHSKSHAKRKASSL